MLPGCWISKALKGELELTLTLLLPPDLHRCTCAHYHQTHTHTHTRRSLHSECVCGADWCLREGSRRGVAVPFTRGTPYGIWCFLTGCLYVHSSSCSLILLKWKAGRKKEFWEVGRFRLYRNTVWEQWVIKTFFSIP